MLIKYNKTFIVKFRIGSVTLLKGNLDQLFINNCKQLIRRWPQKGYAYGVIEDGQLRICFSKSITKDFHQRFRNIYPFRKIGLQSTNTKQAKAVK